MARIASEWNAGYRLDDEPVLWFDARRTPVRGTAGDDRLIGTDAGERFDMRGGGADVVHGHGGNDAILFGDTFGAGDVVAGGAGVDTLVLVLKTDLELTADNFSGVEKIRLEGTTGHLDFSANAEGSFLFLNGSGVLDLSVDSANPNDFKIRGLYGRDHIVSGAGDDMIVGGPSGDFLTGGDGADTFKYNSGGDSGGRYGADLIMDFSDEDRLLLARGTRYVIVDSLQHTGDVTIRYDGSPGLTHVNVMFAPENGGVAKIDLVGNLSFMIYHGHELILDTGGSF